MPRGDRTGPIGYGARTGRGLGICGPSARRAAFVGPGLGRGLGLGRRFWPQATLSKDTIEDEISVLEEQLNGLKALLANDKE